MKLASFAACPCPPTNGFLPVSIYSHVISLEDLGKLVGFGMLVVDISLYIYNQTSLPKRKTD